MGLVLINIFKVKSYEWQSLRYNGQSCRSYTFLNFVRPCFIQHMKGRYMYDRLSVASSYIRSKHFMAIYFDTAIVHIDSKRQT